MRPLGRITSPLTLLLGIATALATSQARAQVAPANPPAASPALTRVPASPATCDEVLTRLWNGRGAFAGAPKAFAPNISSQLLPNNSSACGAAYLAAYLPTLPTDAEKKRAEELYAPARQSLLNALENYSSKQQQTSTTSSTASVSPVSKVTGLSGVAEEFSGISVNSGTSALTFNFAPGTLLSQLGEYDVVIPCTPALNIAPKSGGQSLNGENCMSGALQDIAERLTFSVTANTSTANQSIKGTTTSSSSSSTAASATLSNTGSTEPTFGGFGIKGVAIYQHSKSPPTITDEQTLNQAILNTSLTLRVDLRSCLDSPLRQAAGDAANAQDLNGFLSAAHSHFQALGAALATCLGNNGTDLAMRNYLASIVAYDAAAADVTQTPMLGFEYDLNTPASQPSYSSIKSNFSLGLGSTKAAQTNADCSGNAKTPANTLPCPAAKGALTPGVASPAPTNTAAKSAAKANTQPFTINVSLAVDLYNSEPSSSIPSASRLRDFQGGIELDYIVPSSKIKGIGSLIGDSTLAGSYYYQDQTSPSILTGPPSSITIANLPSTASSVYTARGPINLGQIRYGFGTGTNVSFPIAFTYSNRSELIAHPIKGLQFGISYNLSSLFASAAAKK